MSKADDGGSFHPYRGTRIVTDEALKLAIEEKVDHPGLSLRDWFAGQALANFEIYPPADGDSDQIPPDRIAAFCYQIADAMIAERARQDRAGKE